ncbi:hypothetical protein Mucpa_4074 [Mucilaginibacter paludis DSM 18603]|uniref:Uncharacterized protein n=1 Tax=Mucilaginibacter paludis DSM 18603 TaxID=714943 RepID=H1Y0B6_9SPHI|nr:hypothetical protein Mucpa_4074 [Mucilaginibacter paludis DSM 18603]
MLTFNDKGYLVPNTCIKSNLQEFKNEFVDKIISDQRVALYNNIEHFKITGLLPGTCSLRKIRV